jgi:hypothetical protein
MLFFNSQYRFVANTKPNPADGVWWTVKDRAGSAQNTTGRNTSWRRREGIGKIVLHNSVSNITGLRKMSIRTMKFIRV